MRIKIRIEYKKKKHQTYIEVLTPSGFSWMEPLPGVIISGERFDLLPGSIIIATGKIEVLDIEFGEKKSC